MRSIRSLVALAVPVVLFGGLTMAVACDYPTTPIRAELILCIAEDSLVTPGTGGTQFCVDSVSVGLPDPGDVGG